MPTASQAISNSGVNFYYEKDTRHAVYNFSQDGRTLYRNQPRQPWEFYVQFNLNNDPNGIAKQFIDQYFTTPELDHLSPLVKSIDMPSMKIETQSLNQYNRKRLSQTKIVFEPVKVVFHDVCDGKTLKFWEMYYTYYFRDGIEPNANSPTPPPAPNQPPLSNYPAPLSSGSSPNQLTGINSTSTTTPVSFNGSKAITNNIVTNTLSNHNFGFNFLDASGNWPAKWNKARYLINTIELYQVHGGRYNMVTLVNPKISAFTHDVLNYAASDKVLEITFTFEYEYAFYNTDNLPIYDNSIGQNAQADIGQLQNFFEHGEYLELPSMSFNASLIDFVESNNPVVLSDNAFTSSTNLNVQSSLSTLTNAFSSNLVINPSSIGVLNGLVNLSPGPALSPNAVIPQVRSFAQTAVTNEVSAYVPINYASPITLDSFNV